MSRTSKIEKSMRKGVRNIVNMIGWPTNMDVVHKFLRGYSDRVNGIDSHTKIAPDGEAREINVRLFNGDVLTVMADKKVGHVEEYLIKLDSLENKSFCYTKEGAQPWIE